MRNVTKNGLWFILIIIFSGIMINLQAQTNRILVSLHTEAKPKAAKNKTYVKPAMQVASFQGGDEAWEQYINNHLEYPVIARKNSVEGHVVASFQVSPAGEVKNIKIVESLGFGCDEEVIRLLETSPRWLPAKQGVHAVKSKVQVIVGFKLI